MKLRRQLTVWYISYRTWQPHGISASVSLAGSVPGGEGAGRGLVLCRPDPALPSVLSVSVTSTLRSCSVYRDTWGSARLDTRHTRRVRVDILLLLIKSSPTHCCMSGVWWSLVYPCSVLSPIITTWLRHNAQHSQQATSSHLFINTTIYCTVFTWSAGAVCPLEGFSFHGKTFNAPPNGLESVQITHFTFTAQIKPVFYVHCTV